MPTTGGGRGLRCFWVLLLREVNGTVLADGDKNATNGFIEGHVGSSLDLVNSGQKLCEKTDLIIASMTFAMMTMAAEFDGESWLVSKMMSA